MTGSPSGSLADDNDYQSFGTLFNNYGSSPSDNHYLFTGNESDASESSTDYSLYRNLSTSMGRFNRPDPYDGSYDLSNPQSLNRYSYALNSPTRLVDLTGLDVSWDGNCWVEWDSTDDPYQQSDTGGEDVYCPGDAGTYINPGIDSSPPGYDPSGSEGGAPGAPAAPTPLPVVDPSPKYNNYDICGADALLKNGVSLGIDFLGTLAGFLPGGSTVAWGAQLTLSAASMWNTAQNAHSPYSTGDTIATINSLGGYALTAFSEPGNLKTYGPGLVKAVPI